MRQRRLIILTLNLVGVLALVGGALAFTTAHKTVTLAVDGKEREVRTFGGTVSDVLDKQGVSVGQHDAVAPSVDSSVTDGSRVSVRYGRPLTLRMDDGTEKKYWVTADNVKDALAQLDLRLTGADLTTSRSAGVPRRGLDVGVTLPKQLTVRVDGQRRTVSSPGPTVGDALRDAGIAVDADDEVKPGLATPVADGASVRVVRVVTQTRSRTDALEHDTKVREDEDLDAGERKVVRQGVDGQRRVVYRVTIADGKVRSRTVVSRTTVREPVDQVERRGPDESGGNGNSSDSGPGSDRDFERLAQCESGGNWRTNSGNGYYGGLQFSASTWRAVGGSGLPHQNSKAEQIKRGKILQARSGWGQWPACSSKLGLR